MTTQVRIVVFIALTLGTSTCFAARIVTATWVWGSPSYSFHRALVTNNASEGVNIVELEAEASIGGNLHNYGSGMAQTNSQGGGVDITLVVDNEVCSVYLAKSFATFITSTQYKYGQAQATHYLQPPPGQQCF